MTTKTEVRMLGPPIISTSGHRCNIPTRKAEALLHYLILCPGEQNRSTLALLFWPDHSNPRKRLSHALDQLRRALGCSEDPHLGKRLILATRDTLMFDPEAGVFVDATEFVRLLDLVDRSPYIGPQERQDLLRATELYGGTLLENFLLDERCAEFDEWLISMQYEVEQRYVKAVRALALYEASQGAYPQAIHWFRQYLEIERYDETIHCLLMILHVVNGEPHLAINHYEMHAEVFQERANFALEVSAAKLSHLISSGELDERALSKGVKALLAEAGLDSWPNLTSTMNHIVPKISRCCDDNNTSWL